MVRAQGQAKRSSSDTVYVIICDAHAIHRESVGKTRHAKDRELRAPSTIGIHHRAGRGLRDVGQIVAGIRDFGDLLLVHGDGDVGGFGLNDRRFVRNSNFAAGFRDLKGDIDGCRRANLDNDGSSFFLKSGMHYPERVRSRTQEGELINTFLIGLP